MSAQGIRRPRRLLAACERCHFQKVKCSGAQPCQTCAATGRACHYPAKERKVRVPESYLNQLEADSRRLRGSDKINTPFDDSKDEDEPPSLSKDESNLFNPLFDGQPDRSPHERSLEPAFIGEASCAAFSNRLLSCLDDIYTPLTAGLSNYHRLNTQHGFMIEQSVQFPERMSVKLLLSVARRFIGNYHPLFLEVSFVKEIDAVYQKEIIPSRLWRCKFFALMAVGEIYAHRRGVGDGISVPGINYYEKAVHLMQEDQDYCEEPSLMQVEVLTLLAWVSNIVGRVRTAYCYSGIATRLALSLGMHRAASRYTTLTPVERETRRRTWWVLYFFDRFSASKLGHPIAVRDEDIDVEMPSMEGLATEEMAEFLDPRSLIINIKLGRIIGNILTQIYGIPKATNGRYIHQVHSILKQLRAWHDELPPDMLVRERDTPRTVANLALAFNQCIIQTTRPVLLHLFKTQVQLGSRVREDASSIILALADSCVNAAQASSHIVENLFLDGSIAMFGYYDAQHIFSAAMILIMSAVMKPAAGSSEHLETLLGALRCLRENGNIPAVDFCDRLSHIQTRISTLRATGRLGGGSLERPSRGPPVAGESDSALNHTANQNQLETPSSVNNEAEDHAEILGNPLIGSFLDTNKAEWMDYLFADGTLGEFNTEIEEQFLFGS